MKSKEFVSKSCKQTINFAKEFAKKISPPSLIGISGDLGSGKTVFVKGLALGLGITDLITSPTFLGISESSSCNFPFIHMDFYKKVVPKVIIDEYLENVSVVIIEWIENYFSVFHKDLKTDYLVSIQYLKDKKGVLKKNQRLILIQ